jgi:nucleoside-diphosphate-sugar epimerase
MPITSIPAVFITGASGCVGHYVVDQLVRDHQLFLLVRNPAKLRFDPAGYKNITIVPGDMDSIPDQASILSQMDYCVHIATAWGGQGTERINVDRVHQMFNLLDPDRLRRVIYFSTASILGHDNQAIPEVELYGTDYIKTKYRCYTLLKNCRCFDRIVTVFPTLVFGGDAAHPFSNLSLSLPRLRRFSRLLGRLNINVRFHFIHAQDIAKMTRVLLQLPQARPDYIFGNPPLLFGEFTKRIARFFGHKVNWQITLTPEFIYKLIAIFGNEVTAWDRFSIQHQNFCFNAVNCASFDLPSNYGTVEAILSDWRLAAAK